MDEDTLKSIAAQLRQPHGEYAIQVAEKMNQGNLHINLYTIGALSIKAADKILEIGMGNGLFVKDILNAKNSINYTGCDFSEVMVDQAIKHNQNFIKTGQAKFFLANADNLPFGNQIFDTVFSVNTIYFWDNPQLVLSEIWRVLKHRGKIIIAVRPKSVMEHYPFVKYGFTLFTKEELINLFVTNNFTITAASEKEEPEQEFNGEKLVLKTLLICAEKASSIT